MLKIVNQQGRILELDPMQTITVDKFNPLFNAPDKLLQDVSYPGIAPMSENNKLFFGMGNLVESPNAVYSFPVQVLSDETQIIAGLISYRVSSSPMGFQFNLEPNLTAVNSLLKNIRMTEIRTEDADYSMTTEADLKARMLDTVQNPDKYGYIYFPIYNDVYGDSGSIASSTKFINSFDYAAQQFKISNSSGESGFHNWTWCPFFKVSYIIKQIAAYLGFTCDGSFFINDSYKNLCIYSRHMQGGTPSGTSPLDSAILPCMTYMPNILVTDFLKFLRERLHLALDFNLVTGVLTVETFKTIKSSAKVVDLSAFITTEIEEEVPVAQSFTVTLKTDQQDASFALTDINNIVTYPPLFTLVSGDGSTTIELDCSTVKAHPTPAIAGSKYPWIKQTVYNATISFLLTYPDIACTDTNDPSTLNNWPLRLINYRGFEPVGGSFFPNSEPYDLNQDDIDYYRFINDSKRLIIYASMPAAILANLKLTDKFTHQTAGYNYAKYIVEQISYDAQINADKIPVKIYARMVDYQVNTKVVISPYVKPIAHTVYPYLLARIKAYFNTKQHGIKQLDLQAIDPGGVYTYAVAPITIPTNAKGTGGVASMVLPQTGYAAPTALYETTEIRVLQGQPKYILYQGQRTYFTQVSNYWTVNIKQPTMFSFSGTFNPGIIFDSYTIFF